MGGVGAPGMAMTYDAPGYGGGVGVGGPGMAMTYDAPGYGGGAVVNYDSPGYAGQMSGGLSDERSPLLVAEGAGPRPLVTQPVLMTQALPVPVMNASVASGAPALATYGAPPMSGGSAYSAPQVSGGFTAPQMQLSGGAPQTQVSAGYAAPQTQFAGGYAAPQMQMSGGGAPEGRPQGGMNLLLDPNVIFATIDRNNDGQITRSEFEAAVVGAEMVVPNYGAQ